MSDKPWCYCQDGRTCHWHRSGTTPRQEAERERDDLRNEAKQLRKDLQVSDDVLRLTARREDELEAEVKRLKDYYELCGDCGEARADIPRCTVCTIEYVPRQAALVDALDSSEMQTMPF